MMNLIKRLPFFLLLIGFTLNFVSCDPNAVEIELAAVGVDDLVSEDEVEVPEGDTETGDDGGDDDDDGAVVADEAAEILNGDLEYFRTTHAANNTTYSWDKNDENDIWEASSSSSLKDGSTAPFVNSNSDLKTNAGVKAAGMSSTNHTASGEYSLKFNEAVRVAYQPFAVKTGVTYTIKFWIRGENDSTNDLNVYILNNEVANENDLTGNSDAEYTGSVTDDNDWVEHSFTFTATSSTAVFYAKAGTGVSSDKEIWLDDISVETPGFTDDSDDDSVTAMNEAEILNGDLEYFRTIHVVNNTAYTWNKDDENDIWEASSSSSLKDSSTPPFTNSNSDLKSNAGVKAAGMSSTNHTASGEYSLKFNEAVRVAYQPFTVEIGVTYTIKFWIRGENASTNDLNVYILNNEVANENDLSGNSDAEYTGSVTDDNGWIEHSFTFTATTTTAVFYAKAGTGVSSDKEIWLDDISVETPGF